MIGRSRDLLGDWKKNYPALFEIVQLGCEEKIKLDKKRNRKPRKCKKDSDPAKTT